MRRRAIPSPEANTNLTNDPWMTFGGGTFGNSVQRTELKDRPLIAGASMTLIPNMTLSLAGGHGSRRTFLVIVEEDEHTQV